MIKARPGGTRLDKGSSKPESPAVPEALRASIQTFLGRCTEPAVLDFGDQPIGLKDGQYCLEIRAGRVSIDAWNEQRNLSRRILAAKQTVTGALDCVVQQFGGATGKLSFLDLARPQTTTRCAKGSRQNFAEQFRRMLHRQFPGWEIEALSSAMDLRRSFSAAFPRARISRGNQFAAALACATAEDEPAFLSSALLWFDHLRGLLPLSAHLSLCIFLPEGAGNLSAHRLRWLTGRELRTRIFLFNEHGMAGEVDPQDLGNLDTHLTSRYCEISLSEDLRPAMMRLEAISGVGCCPEIGGAISVRFRGLEFARIERNRVFLGIDSKEEIALSRFNRVIEFARQLAALGAPRERRHSQVPAYPERWFESQVRRHLQVLDAELLPAPVHGQVLTFAGAERELIDLLAASAGGRLAVLELKTSEDIHLPLQSLDYWMRVKWHLERGELDSLFPGVPLVQKPPRLLLVAPAFVFHPSNEIVLRYFAPSVEVERVGVNSDWDSAFAVAFRLRGAEVPISHRGFDETRRIGQYKKGDHDPQPE